MKKIIFLITILGFITLGFSQENKTINELIDDIVDATYLQYEYIKQIKSSEEKEKKIEAAKKLHNQTVYKVLQLFSKTINRAQMQYIAVNEKDVSKKQKALDLVGLLSSCKQWQITLKNQTKVILDQASENEDMCTNEFIDQQQDRLLTSFTNFIMNMEFVSRNMEETDTSNYENGIQTNRSSNNTSYSNSFEEIKKAAEQGVAKAQYRLANMYYEGEGTTKDLKKAFEWYQKAAEQGDAEAQNAVALMYFYGEGTVKDANKAFEWAQKAAVQGNAEAQNAVALMCFYGEGTTKDFKKAFEWYQKAAEQENAKAKYYLGRMYYDGNGIEKDIAKALFWYQKAAEQGYIVAQNRLWTMYYFGIGVEKDYNKAVFWCKKAAKQNNAVDQNNLGYMYQQGYGVEKDQVKAEYWFKKACKNGNKSACEKLKK